MYHSNSYLTDYLEAFIFYSLAVVVLRDPIVRVDLAAKQSSVQPVKEHVHAGTVSHCLRPVNTPPQVHCHDTAEQIESNRLSSVENSCVRHIRQGAQMVVVKRPAPSILQVIGALELVRRSQGKPIKLLAHINTLLVRTLSCSWQTG